MRMFVAVLPPPDVVADLARFLAPRAEATPQWRWSPEENWHVTLAFCPEVRDVERLVDSLAATAANHRPFALGLDGAGAIPDLARARHLYQAVPDPTGELAVLARHVRSAALTAGVPVDGKAFRPHLTVARHPRSGAATHLWRALETYSSRRFDVTDIALLSSRLGAGRGGASRYDVWERFALGG